MYHWRERLFGALKGKHFVRIISPLVGMVVLVTFLASNASAGTTPTTYYACVNMRSGSIYMVNVGDTCQKGYTPINWNQVGPQGPQGPTGPQGPQGPQGPAGPTQTLTSIQVYSVNDAISTGAGGAEARCPTGTLVTGGGYETLQAADLATYIVEASFPPLNRNSWEVEIFNSGTANVSLTVYALCASLV